MLDENYDFFLPLLRDNPWRKHLRVFLRYFSQPSQIPIACVPGGVNRLCKKSSVYSQITCITDRQTESDLNSGAFYVKLARN